MKYLKRVMLILTILAFVGPSLFAGGQQAATETDADDGVVTWDVAAIMEGEVIFRDGELIEDNVHTRWAEEELGIRMNHIWSVGTWDAAVQKIRLDLAGNQPLPDVFSVRDPLLLADLIESGRLKDITEAWEDAPQRTRRVYEGYEDAFLPGSSDGRLYAFPFLSSMTGGSVMFIRQDWLNAIGMDAPTTLTELEEVMEAFKTRDLDGNGVNDTVPLAASLRDGVRSGIGALDWVFGAYGEFMPESWNRDGEDLVYGSIQPSVKEAIAKISEWMDKEYLDQEAALLNGRQALDLFVAGDAGIVFAPYWVVNNLMTPLTVNVPDADYQPYPLPVGPEGEIGYAAPSPIDRWVVFSRDFDHMDSWWEYHGKLLNKAIYDTTPQDDFYYGWAEGYDWVIVDGEPSTDPDDVPGGFIFVKKYFSPVGNEDLDVPGMYDDDLVKFYNNPNAEAANPREAYVTGWKPKQIIAGYYRVQMMRAGYAIPNVFGNAAPTPAMREFQERLLTLERQSFNDIIYGEEPLSTFDRFVEQWKGQGGQQITREVNAWYDSAK